ncbi:hypothetical protein EW145_g648 [Phellinidium pouzarii]|uniref:Large ribosomal subunit protein mL59 domain-containing protein n=1 Tax=Phellinidium pouzarii TaxID=167371 RepID=A0A4S4LJ60_9AGAM|nr:hypothetical protein EW145_g648 [Phellinidium pouzarii]
MPPAVPPIVQRFRAREVQRLVTSVVVHRHRANDPKLHMKDVDVAKVRMGTPLHNPFLPRPLFDRSSTSDSTGEADSASQADNASQAVKQRKKWATPKYSLRRQADLVKAARASGTLHLLPPGPKLTVAELEEAKQEAREKARSAKVSQLAVKKAIETRRAVQSPAEPVANVEGGLQSGEEMVESVADLAVPSLTLSKLQSLSLNSQKSTGLKRGKWIVRNAHALAKRRGSAQAGYPGIVFHWTGDVPLKASAKKNGLTIYAGRKRMFKGHKWERQLDKRRGKIAVRMRDMRKRIKRFRNVYLKKRVRPLSPAKPRKKETLPF